MITFSEETHTYYNNGALIPSVSELVSFALGEDFSMIPKDTLKYAQDFGTDIHKAIQDFLEQGVTSEFDDPYKTEAFNAFMELREPIKDPKCEFMVDYEGRYAGRVDCLANNRLIDFKTNSQLNKDHLKWQLGYYRLALGKEVECWCLWLPKRKYGEWVKVEPIKRDELLRNLESYEKQAYESYRNFPFS